MNKRRRRILERAAHSALSGGLLPRHHLAESLEPRRLLSSNPAVLSIVRASLTGPDAYPPAVDYTVTFSQPVTGVDATDFVVNTDSGLAISSPLTVTPVNASVYTVQISGIRGQGQLTLALRDDGTIRNSQNLPLSNSQFVFRPSPASNPSPITGDFNGDGIPDTVSMDSARVNVTFGNGDGTFRPPTNFTFSQNFGSAFAVTAADLNSDGLCDVLFQSANGSTLNELLGNGNGTFLALRTIAAVSFVNAIDVTDLNSDGRPDLVESDVGTPAVRVLLGLGGGSFAPAQVVRAPISSRYDGRR